MVPGQDRHCRCDQQPGLSPFTGDTIRCASTRRDTVCRVPHVDLIRDARPEERDALEALQWRASLVWEQDRQALLAHPDAIELPLPMIIEGRVRVAVGEEAILGFSVVLPIHDGMCELDGLFVEPDAMRHGVGRALVIDVVARARRDGATHIEVIANPRAEEFYTRVGF